MKVTGCENPSWRIVVVKNGRVGNILAKMERFHVWSFFPISVIAWILLRHV